jgi:hypothetical protein
MIVIDERLADAAWLPCSTFNGKSSMNERSPRCESGCGMFSEK